MAANGLQAVVSLKFLSVSLAREVIVKSALSNGYPFISGITMNHRRPAVNNKTALNYGENQGMMFNNIPL